MRSNCCSAQVTGEIIDSFGRCSQCMEMAQFDYGHTIVEGLDTDGDGGAVEIEECIVCLGPLFVTCPGERPKQYANIKHTKLERNDDVQI